MIALNRMGIWLDEPEGEIYFVYREQYGATSFLLSVRLPADLKAKRP